MQHTFRHWDGAEYERLLKTLSLPDNKPFRDFSRMTHDGSFTVAGFASMLALILLLSMLASAISLPFMFKLGVEKGRAAYYVMIGVICAGGAMGSVLLQGNTLLTGGMRVALPLLCVAGVVLYALSWYWSIRLYEKREVV